MTTVSVTPAPLHTSDMQHNNNNNKGERRKGGSNGKRRKNSGRGTQRGNNKISLPPNDDDEEDEDEDETDTSPPGTASTPISPASLENHLHSQTDSEHFSHASQEEEKKQAHGEEEEYFIRRAKPTGNGKNADTDDDQGGTDILHTDRSLAFSPAFSEIGPGSAVDGDEGDDEEEDEDDDNEDEHDHDKESGYRDHELPLKTGDKQDYILYGAEDDEEDDDDDDDDDDDGYSNSDPFVYSDDSESLSDAYFHPQPERRLPNSNFFYPQQQSLDPYRSLNIATQPEEVNSTSSAAGAPNSRAYANISLPPHDPAHSEHNPHQNRPKAPLSSYGSMASHHSSSAAPERGIIPWSKSNSVSLINTTFAGGTILEDYPVEEEDVVVWHTANSRNSDHPFYNDQQLWQNQQQQRSKLPPHHHHDRYQQSEQPPQSRRSKKYHRKRPKRNRRRRPLHHHHRERRDSGDFEPHRQQQQYAREHAVTRVRGKQQNVQSCNDSWCAILFVIQFLFVMACAIRYGCTLMRPTPLVNPSLITMAITTIPANNDKSSNSSMGDYFNPTSPSALHQADEVHKPPAVSSPKATTAIATGTGATTSTTASTTMDKDGSTTTITLGKIGDGGKTTTTRSSTSSLDDDMITDMGYNVAKKKGDSQTPIITATTAKTSSTTPTTIVEVTTVNGIAEFSIDYQNVIKLLCVSGMYACVISYLTFGFMLIVARSLIQIILVFSVVLALAWGICGTVFSDPDGFIALMGFSALILSLWYAVYSWNRIPFASTNLYTAMCAMRCTADIILLGAATLLISFLWCLVWAIALMGVVNMGNSNDCIETDECQTHIKTNHWNVPTYFLFLFSFYWTNMVIKNITRVTVASTIGTWWFRPREIHPCCSHAVGRPLVRALTTSFGSICLGSLVVFPAQLITFLSGCCCWFSRYETEEQPQKLFSTSSPTISGKGGGTNTPEGKKPTTPATEASPLTISSNLSENNLENESDAVASTGMRCHSKVLARIRRFIRSSNQWSYTYVGMYGYRFVEGGEKALELFETREWMEVVRDNLIQNILLIASVVIGGSAGTFAVLVEEVDGYMFTTLNRPIITSCLLGSVLGYVLSSVLLLGVVGSAVNTILVCFAAGPFEFDKNHPRLSREMREVWSQQVWEPSDSVV